MECVQMVVVRRRGYSQRYTSDEFRPYVTAIGQVALAWNDLQESLKGLFWTILSPFPVAGDRVDYTPLWVWSSIKSDRSQRDMLMAASQKSQRDWNRPSARDDIKWILDRAESLEQSRNDAIHSPLFSAKKSLWGIQADASKRESVAPAYWLFNPRAVSLAKRDTLLGEFRFCRDTAIVLSDYAQAVDGALVNQNRPWPERPKLPNRGQKRSRPGPHRQPDTK